jgi:hypothetical protein
MSNTAQTLTAPQLKRALALREKIDKLERKLADVLGTPAAAAAAPKTAKKRRMSAAGRLAISRAAKARWARERAGKKASSK